MSTDVEIRAAIAAHPDLTDRQIARKVKHRWWTDVRRIRELLAADPGVGVLVAAADPEPEPVRILADDVPAASDDPPAPRRPVIAANPTATCANCGREGTPHPGRPEWCKACASDAAVARHRAGWPPISDRAAQALALIPRAPAPVDDWLRRRYLRERAADFGLLEASDDPR